jgi:hypothetical protein
MRLEVTPTYSVPFRPLAMMQVAMNRRCDGIRTTYRFIALAAITIPQRPARYRHPSANLA